MGHRFSKTAAAHNIAAAKTTTANSSEQQAFLANTTTTTTQRIPIPNGNNHFVGPTINLQIQESPSIQHQHPHPHLQQQQQQTTCNSTSTSAAGLLQHQPNSTASISSSSLTSVNNLSSGGRQIIIKIQLAKMENGNETPSSLLQQQQQQYQDTSLESLTADCNLNSTEFSATTTTTTAGAQILNLTLNSNTMPNTAAAATTTTSSSSSTTLSRTAGSSLTKNNYYLNSNNGGGVSCSATSSALTPSSSNTINGVNNQQQQHHHMLLTNSCNERLGRFNTLQFNNEIVDQNIGEIVEYCEVLEEQNQQPPISTRTLATIEEPDNETNVCCRRKSKSLAANNGGLMSSNSSTTTSSAGTKTKSRCRKCSCRDAFRRILEPSLSRSSNKANKQQQKEQKRPKSQDRHSINNIPQNNARSIQRHTMHSTTTPTPVTIATSSNAAAAAAANHVSLWTPTTTNVSDVIIPLTTPQQFVVVQCAIVNPGTAAAVPRAATTNTASTCSLSNSIISISNDISSSTTSSNDIMVKVPSSKTPGSSAANTTTAGGPIVHSQVDFVHYLVPDLERITNSSFYWGKMDRYEAERLLEGKPEGTFLLRDSAQEEFLFSVTFRKYGRSLHARIEQSGHRFSFDCHDPCVFTAPTVTGLLEHYKDPACVMFFEPMLTIPLHRKNCFSLQKLCRATIVSNTTYDGINELELPARLKSYLKEYHYKQKLRVKSNEPTYTIHCK